MALHLQRKYDGNRSLSLVRCSGFNYLLLPKDRADAQIVDELKPGDDEIQICKTTDSALTGTNLRLLLANMGIKTVICTGIFTDQCVASTVRSLADESFDVLVRVGLDDLPRWLVFCGWETYRSHLCC